MRMRKMRMTLTAFAAFLLCVLLMAAGASAQSGDDISFTVTPDGKGRARVGVEVSGDYSKVEAKTIQTVDWRDITRDMSVTISEDCIVYVQVTERGGGVVSKSAYVEIPAGTNSTTAQQSPPGNSNGTAAPSESGAGTVSQPASETATVSTEPPAAATATNRETTAAPTTDPASAGIPAAVPEAPKEVKGVITVGNKQFVTIETRDEEIFYLIIDGDRSEDNVYLVSEVTTQDLLSFAKDGPDAGAGSQPAADADPASLIDGGVLPAPTDPADLIPVESGGEGGTAASEASGTDEASDETEPQDEDAEAANPIPGWIMIAILALITAFAGYMFLIVLPRKKAKEAYADTADDEDDLDEDYREAPESEVIPPEVQADLDDDEDENPLNIPVDDDEE